MVAARGRKCGDYLGGRLNSITPPPPVVVPPPKPPGSAIGTITSSLLPALGKLAPYSANGSSKHTNMATDGNRLYVIGGDWAHSATDGMWSAPLNNLSDWRQEFGEDYRPAPHALQDGAGFDWVAARKQFIAWPGSYYWYEADGDPVIAYARGIWWIDPMTNKCAQDNRLFGGDHTHTGCLYGGAFDEVNGHIVAFADSSGGFACRRWDVNLGTRLPDLTLTIKRDANFIAAYFAQGKYVKIGRYVYVVGYRTDGASKVPMMFRWHLDAHTTEELAPPPIDGALVKLIEIRIAQSHGKVVWPVTTGPDGKVHALLVYDPALNKWMIDAQPLPDSFMGNAICSLDDGRVILAGGVFGKQQTHINCYEAA